MHLGDSMKAALVRVSQKPECELGIATMEMQSQEGHRVLLRTELSFLISQLQGFLSLERRDFGNCQILEIR